MNINNFFTDTDKEVFVKNILKDKGAVTLIQIKKGSMLKEHQSMTNALLILVSGKARYEEKSRKEFLSTAFDMVNIAPHVSHKVIGEEDSFLMLIQ